MLVNLACDWGRPSRNWPCAWTPSDYYRFLLSVSRNSFLSTDLQSAFWKRFGKEPSLGFPMDLTNLQALLNDQKASSHSEWTSHQLAFRLLHTRQQHLTDGLGKARPLQAMKPRIPLCIESVTPGVFAVSLASSTLVRLLPEKLVLHNPKYLVLCVDGLSARSRGCLWAARNCRFT